MKEIKINREWLERLVALNESLKEANRKKENHASQINYIIGYIDSAKFILK
jgi:hypothetical protein